MVALMMAEIRLIKIRVKMQVRKWMRGTLSSWCAEGPVQEVLELTTND